MGVLVLRTLPSEELPAARAACAFDLAEAADELAPDLRPESSVTPETAMGRAGTEARRGRERFVR
jgi:hypothetical protein